MGRNRIEYSNDDINVLKMEVYCASCDISFYKENCKKGRMAQRFYAHCNTKKHKTNTERYRFELELKQHQYQHQPTVLYNDDKKDSDSKLYINYDDLDDKTDINSQPLINNNKDLIMDDHLTSISSIIKDHQIKKIDETCSVLSSNYRQMKSVTQSLVQNHVDYKDKIGKEIEKINHDNNKMNNKLKSLENKIETIVSSSSSTISNNNNNNNKKKKVNFGKKDEEDEEEDDNSLDKNKIIKRKIWKLLLKQNELILFSNNNLLTIKEELASLYDELISLINVNTTANNIKMWKLCLEQIDILDNLDNNKISNNYITKFKKIYNELVSLSNL